VCNNIICIGLANMHILRLNLAQPDVLTTIPVTQHQANEQIYKLFLDPTGTHLIISMSTANNWYLHGTWKKKLFYLKDMKGIIVESVAWDTQNTDPETTANFLIGTTTGSLYESRIDVPQGQLAKCKQKTFRPIYTVGEGTSVTGLFWERFPPNGTGVTKLLIMATTATRFYQFVGGPTFANVRGASLSILLSTYSGVWDLTGL
jgi:vacuolar protein sorting-associated protein 18